MRDDNMGGVLPSMESLRSAGKAGPFKFADPGTGPALPSLCCSCVFNFHINLNGSPPGSIVFPLISRDRQSIYLVPFALQCDSRFLHASSGALLRCTISSAIPLQLLISVIQATCAFRKLTGSTLQLSKNITPNAQPTPFGCSQFFFKSIRPSLVQNSQTLRQPA